MKPRFNKAGIELPNVKPIGKIVYRFRIKYVVLNKILAAVFYAIFIAYFHIFNFIVE